MMAMKLIEVLRGRLGRSCGTRGSPSKKALRTSLSSKPEAEMDLLCSKSQSPSQRIIPLAPLKPDFFNCFTFSFSAEDMLFLTRNTWSYTWMAAGPVRRIRIIGYLEIGFAIRNDDRVARKILACYLV